MRQIDCSDWLQTIPSFCLPLSENKLPCAPSSTPLMSAETYTNLQLFDIDSCLQSFKNVKEVSFFFAQEANIVTQDTHTIVHSKTSASPTSIANWDSPCPIQIPSKISSSISNIISNANTCTNTCTNTCINIYTNTCTNTSTCINTNLNMNPITNRIDKKRSYDDTVLNLTLDINKEI